LDTTHGRYVLTLYERRVDPAELPWFLGLMRHLAAQGVACPQPVPGRDGEALRELAGRPAAICTFLEGAWPRQVAPAHCAELGRAMAGLHAAGRSYAAE
ncbi:phosphotransferase, partial [Roseomonas sp. DSM 102946]|nr:phosphotransferase [Roseomonas sp. DSM 102946]